MKRVGVTTAAVLLSLNAAAAAQPPANPGSQRSIDIVVTRYVEDARGARVGMPAQTIRYRMSRIKTETGWKTVMTIGAPLEASPEDVSANPYFGGRVEFEEGGKYAVFDSAGREVPLPSKLRIPAIELPGADWSAVLEGVSTAPQKRKARVDEIEQKYGRPNGRVGGLSQYMRRSGEVIEEVLFDETLGVPKEVNVILGTKLTGRVVFDYVPQPGGGVVRRAVRSEALVNEQGDRAITATEFARVASEPEQ